MTTVRPELRDRVLARMRERPGLTAHELGRALGYNPRNAAASIRRYLLELEDAGLAVADRSDPHRFTWRAL